MAPEEGVPLQVVLCFFQEVIETVVASHGVLERSPFKAEHGIHPFWELDWEGKRFGLFHPGVGAPLAAAFLEEAIAKGCRSFIACGGAGALVPELTLGHVVVPTSAIVTRAPATTTSRPAAAWPRALWPSRRSRRRSTRMGCPM